MRPSLGDDGHDRGRFVLLDIASLDIWIARPRSLTWTLSSMVASVTSCLCSNSRSINSTLILPCPTVAAMCCVYMRAFDPDCIFLARLTTVPPLEFMQGRFVARVIEDARGDINVP